MFIIIMELAFDFLDHKYNVLSTTEYENIVRHKASYALLLGLYHYNKMIIVINDKYYIMYPLIYGLTLLNKDFKYNHDVKKCNECLKNKINDESVMIDKILSNYPKQRITFNMEIRHRRMIRGEETANERKIRQNVNYTVAILLSNKLKEKINDFVLIHIFSEYIYKYLCTTYLLHEFYYDTPLKTNVHLVYLECVMDKKNANYIRSIMDFKTNIHSSEYKNVYDGDKLIKIMTKPSGIAYPSIVPNKNPLLHAFKPI